MSFTTIFIIRVYNKLKRNRFGFSSQIMFDMCPSVWRLRINSLKINLNSFIRNNVESGRRVFTLWVMQLHKLIPAHFTVSFHRALIWGQFLLQHWWCSCDRIEKHCDWLQISDFLKLQCLRVCSAVWEIVSSVSAEKHDSCFLPWSLLHHSKLFVWYWKCMLRYCGRHKIVVLTAWIQVCRRCAIDYITIALKSSVRKLVSCIAARGLHRQLPTKAAS